MNTNKKNEKERNKKKWGCGCGCLIFIFILLIGGCVALIGDGEDDNKDNKKATKQVTTTTTEDKESVVGESEETKETVNKETQQQEELAKSLNLELVTVGRVIDGDTFATSDGRKIRIVGVNTPESTNRTEEYGKEASNYTSSKLIGKQVWLEKDVSETDRFDRLLRIVWLAVPTNLTDENEIRTKMFNADLLLNGYAEPSTYPPDVKYSDFFVKFAREAREANKGLWAFGEDGTTKGDLDNENVTTTDNSSSSSSSVTTSTNTGTTTSTGTSESYQNCTELRKVYPNGVPSDHPAYESKHDRDKDNFACER